MGKAKPTKKPSTPVKISTSLFHQRKSKHLSSDSSTDSSSSLSPNQLTKKKATKTPHKPKSKASPGGKSTPKGKAIARKEKSESKKKVGTNSKAKEKQKKNEETKGRKRNLGKSRVKEKSVLKKAKSASPKPKRKPAARGRSQSSTNSDSSSSSTEDESSSSRTRSPSPPRKSGSGKKTSSAAAKPKASPKKAARKDSDKKVPKTSKISPKKAKLALNKKIPVKGKGKQTKPKAKLKRMASLNAKAILEASFSFEATDKKKSPAGTPVKSPKGSLDGDGGDFKPLTLLFSSPAETEFTKDSQSPKSGERKRKSTSAPKGSESPNRTEEATSNGSSTQFGQKRRESDSSNPQLIKCEKEKSRSPAPKKKSRVMSSSVSTSTSPFDPVEDAKIQLLTSEQYAKNSNATLGDMNLQRSFTLSTFQEQQNLLSDESPNHFHHHLPGTVKGRGKEKAKSVTPTSGMPFGSTVYQPAGPLIEPHKIAAVPAGVLPETVRIPSDLKVTYQTRPPTSAVLTVSSSGSQKGSEKTSEGRHGGSKATPTTSISQRSQSKQILHQPYKSATTSSLTVTTSTKQPQPPTFIHSPLAVNSTFSAQGGGSLMMGSGGGPMAVGTLTQSAALSSHINPSSAIMTSGTAAGNGSLYFGYGGSHQSPFAPSKFPIVPPDSFRPQSPFQSTYLYPPGAPQASPSYFMTPSFYNPQAVGQPPGGNTGISIGAAPRPMFAHQHPGLGGSGVPGAPFYQPPPPSSHPVSNYYVAPPIVPPSHHSMQPSTAPGHAGPSLPNPLSQPACPTDSSQRNNNSTSSNNSSTSITISNNKTNRSLLRKLPQQLHATSATVPLGSAPVDTKPRIPKSVNMIRNSSQILSHSSPTASVQKLSRIAKNMKQRMPTTELLERNKTFTEQYSLPDDITITPIIMNTTESKALSFNSYVPILPKTEKKKDIVHVIDTRSGESTTIAKHISINNIHRNSLTPRNVSSVKPNNAGNVGKISPSLDVIVLNPERKQMMGKTKMISGEGMEQNRACQRPALLISPGVNTDYAPFKNNHSIGKSLLLSNSNTNLVQPFYQPTATMNENKSKAIKRKGLTLNECIDGLQRKKMRILADTNVSITNVTPSFPTSNNMVTSSVPQEHRQVTHFTPADNQAQSLLNTMKCKNINQLLPGKMTRKVNNSKAREAASLRFEPSKRQGNQPKRTASTESDFGTKVIDCNAAEAAVSALLIPPSSLAMAPTTNSSCHPYAIQTTGIKKQSNEKKKPPLKIKLYKSDVGKITTRSNTQTSKLRSRNHKLKIAEGKELTKLGRGRSRLLIRDRDGSKCDSSGSITPNFLPFYHQTQGNGSSTLTTSNNHVILRIPKASGERSKGDYHSRINYGVGSGNMTINAMKKRAIVKPLSPALINGTIHSLALSNKRLPVHTHPRWSNGWRFEGKAFEAKVYIKNDDNPVLRRCYPAMHHDGGDVIRARDCVLLKSGPRKTDLPFVAKVAALFENPADGEMMFSLLWYYRPEHTDIGRNKEDMVDEIFASKHRDSNSVATIEDKCYVFTFNEYCRYKKRLKQLLEGVPEATPIVPLSKIHSETRVPVTNVATDIANAVWFGISATVSGHNFPSIVPFQNSPLTGLPAPVSDRRPSQPVGKVSPEVVFFCRRVYDYRQKRMLKNPS